MSAGPGYVAYKAIAEDYKLHSRLKRLFEKDAFNKDYEEWVAAKERGMAGPVEDSRWYNAIRDEFFGGFKAARQHLQRTDPEFKQAVADEKKRKRNSKQGRYDKLVGMPVK